MVADKNLWPSVEIQVDFAEGITERLLLARISPLSFHISTTSVISLSIYLTHFTFRIVKIPTPLLKTSVPSSI